MKKIKSPKRIGRPPLKGDETMRVISSRLPLSWKETIKAKAKAKGLSTSEFVRECLENPKTDGPAKGEIIKPYWRTAFRLPAALVDKCIAADAASPWGKGNAQTGMRILLGNTLNLTGDS